MRPAVLPFVVFLLVGLGCGDGGTSEQSTGADGREAQLHQVHIGSAEAPSPQPVRIMPLGDSITSSWDGRNSYRYWLWHMLESAGFNVDFVGTQYGVQWGLPPVDDFDLDHEGHYGWRADELLAGLPLWAAVFRPDIVLVHAGTNDILQGQGALDAASDLEAIIQVLRAENPEVTVLLAQVVPADESLAGLEALNSLIPRIAASSSTGASPVLVVDQFSGYDYFSDSVDGIHPNESGERKIAGQWFNALAVLLAEQGSSELQLDE